MTCSTSSTKRCPAMKRWATGACCWAAGAHSTTPDACDYTYKNMGDWGREMFVTPGVIVDGKLVTNDLVDINLNIRILLGSSYYDDWENGEIFVEKDPLGNPVDRRHPWNQTTIPRPQKRNFEDKYTWVMSPRWYDKRTNEHLALDTGGGADRAVVVDGAVEPGGYRVRESDGHKREDLPAQDGLKTRGRV